MRQAFRWMRVGIGLSLTGLFLGLAVRHIRFAGLAATLKQVQWSWLGIALTSLVCGYTTRIYRWWWMLRSINPAVQFRSCVWPLIVGFAVNNVAPFRAGDAFRIVGFREQLDTPAVRLLGSLLIERMLDLTLLLAFFLTGIAVLWSDGSAAPYLRTAIVVVGLGLLAWLVLLCMGGRLERWVLRACDARYLNARGWASAARSHTQNLFVALNIVRSPPRALQLLILSAWVWGFEGLVFAAVARSLHYEGGAFGPWFALATGSLSTLVPSSPGYVGTFDFFTISGLTAFGASAAVAATTAFLVHGVLWFPLTAAGGAYFLLTGLRGRGPESLTTLTRAQEKL